MMIWYNYSKVYTNGGLKLYIIFLEKEKEMKAQTLQTFYASLLELSAQKTIELQELNQRNWKQCLTRFTLHVANSLEFDENLMIIALLIAKRAVDHDLKASKKIMHKLVIVSFLIAEKMYQEEHHSLESFSLVSGVTIRELAQLEEKILLLIDFQVFIEEENLAKLKMGKVEELFQRAYVDANAREQ